VVDARGQVGGRQASVTGLSASRARWGLVAAAVAVLTAAAVLLALVAGTGSRARGTAASGPTPVGSHSAAAADPTTTRPPIPKVTIAQPGVSKGVQSWKLPVRVKVSHGTLLAVTAVDDTGVALAGTITGSSWMSTGVVVPSRTYHLRTSVQSLDGVTAVHTLHVMTSAPDKTVHVKVNLQVGPAVGVGWPIIVHFTQPVTDRAAVQKALQVQTSVPVACAWHWFSDTEVHCRPEVYWPAHTQIVLHRNLDGIEVSAGVWGTEDTDVHFTVGDKHVTTVNAGTPGQYMTVTVNDKRLWGVKVSTGRASLPTLGGVHIVLEKWAVYEMKSWTLKPPIPKLLPNGQKNTLAYDERELWATRISDGGAFVHYNPKTLTEQGAAAASHGCVNTNLAAAQRFYDLSLPGDIVKVINSPAPPNRADPGMQDWNYTWAQWLDGSATRT
jgi:lipoprotein-anchoring transpeptidase ErfK/SrfK